MRKIFQSVRVFAAPLAAVTLAGAFTAVLPSALTVNGDTKIFPVDSVNGTRWADTMCVYKDRPTTQQSMPWAGLPAGVPARRLSWAWLQLRDRRALMTGVCLSRRRLPALQFAGPGLTAHSLPGPLCIVSVVWFPGGMSVSQCSKEDGRSSSGPPHETAAPKRTYDMMEGRVSRAISSASIEGVCPARLPTLGVERGP